MSSKRLKVRGSFVVLMVFWKKEAARDVLNLLRDVKKRIGAVRDFARQKDVLLRVIKEIDDSLDEVKAAIAARAQEEKSKPWIDRQFDVVIDALAAKEIERVNNIESGLAVYAQLAEESSSAEDLELSVEGLMDEAQAIEEREASHAAQIDSLVRESLREHLRTASDPVPAGRLKDGVSFSDVLAVARQLGGWGVASRGAHPYQIVFPSGARPITLSKDVGSQLVAKAIVQQLKFSLPAHKVPSQSDVQQWLKRGKAA